jgi:hypothetical protein
MGWFFQFQPNLFPSIRRQAHAVHLHGLLSGLTTGFVLVSQVLHGYAFFYIFFIFKK